MEPEDDKTRRALEAFTRGLPMLEAQLKCLTITDDASSQMAAELVGKAARAKELAEKIHADLLAPHKAKVTAIDGTWRPIIKGFATIVQETKLKVQDWILSERQKRLREEAAAAAMLREQQERQRAAERAAAAATTTAERLRNEVEAGRAFQQQEEIIDSMPEPAPTKIQAPGISLNAQEDWDYIVDDIGLFASAHPSCVEVKRGETLKVIRLAAKEKRNVPGLRIIDKAKIVIGD